MALAETLARTAANAAGGSVYWPPSELKELFSDVDVGTATDCCLCFLARRQLDAKKNLNAS